jgi:hypothetical protein
MTAQRFKKMPLEIEAMQFTGGAENATPIIDWILEHDGTASWHEANEETGQEEGLFIQTLEGVMHASVGDWIIKGIENEFYPCKPQIFTDSYLSVGTDAPRDVLNIEWPRILPEGTPITRKGLKAAWSEFMTPLQEAGRNSEPNVKTLLAVFRHVYSEMPADK